MPEWRTLDEVEGHLVHEMMENWTRGFLDQIGRDVQEGREQVAFGKPLGEVTEDFDWGLLDEISRDVKEEREAD